MEDQLPARRRVDLLGQAPEGDLLLIDVVNQVDQPRKRPTETIEPPDDERVTRPQVVACRVELRTAGLRSG